jgi:putative CocE/NonD family hydrolase
VRLLRALSRRELPAPVCDVRLERAVAVPMADGVTLLADHYWPLVDGTAPTVLIRSPYGRGFPWDWVYGTLLAGQGFHVLLQSCRGTAGSGGEFEPFVSEAADGQATVAWLRGQDWFNGSLSTIGASYLGFTQWALAADPPPELRAMVVQVGSDDFHGFLYPGGALALESVLVGVTGMLALPRGFRRFCTALLRLQRHRKAVARSLPLRDAYPAALGQRVPWLDRWLDHPAADDPFWASRRADPRIDAAPPVLLLGGWADVCLDPTLDAYQRLRAAGRDVRLVVGPWNHTSAFDRDLPTVLGEALRWLRLHLTVEDRAPVAGDALPVRVWVSAIGPGGPQGEKRDLAGWPPPVTADQQWRLSAAGELLAPGQAGGPDSAHGTAVSAFRYDPADPTPSVGGPSMDTRGFGPQRNDSLEARPDVLTFTSAPLGGALEIAGPVQVRLRVRGSSRYFDVFGRLCDVDEAGRSWNICDGLLRLGLAGDRASADHGSAGQDTDGWTEITVPLSSAAHRFGSGHRIRLQVSGGAHPRFARNTGTGEPLATATSLVTVDIELAHDPARPAELTLPITAG